MGNVTVGAGDDEDLVELERLQGALDGSLLRAVVEPEGCRRLLEGSAVLWSGLERLALGPSGAARPSERAARLVEAAEVLWLDALEQATHPPTGEGLPLTCPDSQAPSYSPGRRAAVSGGMSTVCESRVEQPR